MNKPFHAARRTRIQFLRRTSVFSSSRPFSPHEFVRFVAVSPQSFIRDRLRRSHHGGSSISRAAGTLSQGLKNTSSFLARNFWLWPLIGLTLLSIIGMMIHRSIESTMKSSMQSEMKTLLEVETAMLRTWLTSQEGNAESVANNINVRLLTLRLLGEEESLMGVTQDPASPETAPGDVHVQLAQAHFASTQRT